MNVKALSVILMMVIIGAMFVSSHVSYPWELNPGSNVSGQGQLEKFNFPDKTMIPASISVQRQLKKFKSLDEITVFLKKNAVRKSYGGYFNLPDKIITPTNNLPEQDRLKKFKSLDEIKSFIKKNTGRRNYGGYGTLESESTTRMLAAKVAGAGVAGGGTGDSESPMPSYAPPLAERAGDFSTTNIQVQGVDEADIVKNDDKYIYVLSGGKISIVEAYPPESAEILSTVDVEGNPAEIYINGDRLVVVGNIPGKTVLYVYDVSNRRTPRLTREISVDGVYFDSRMISDYVYVIASKHAHYNDVAIPEITDSETAIAKTPDVYYFDVPDSSYSFTTIISVDVQSEDKEVYGGIYLLGSARNLYVSRSNIYITYRRLMTEPYSYERVVDAVITPLVPENVFGKIGDIKNSGTMSEEKERNIKRVIDEYLENLPLPERVALEKIIRRETESLKREITKGYEGTVIHKLAIGGGEIEYVAGGEVPGRILNQFSMDEYDSYFRIATTTGRVSGRGAQTSANHIYVLDRGLEIVGKLEDLAPGERIYSARFMGERAYLVTFKKVDPLFVIDLSNPENPKVLGKLKIPGYSDYLHPYDENHIIGIGKDAVGAEGGDFAWYQGIKLALFDVSDVENPKEISKFMIGDRGTDSYALRDHKAFLFSKEKNLLVIPVLLAEINEDRYYGGIPKNAYGEHVWQGAYVFNIDTENGLTLKGRISHNGESGSFGKSRRFYQNSKYAIKRSLYMDDTLYTISDGIIKMNGLEYLYEINRVYLQAEEEPVYGYMPEGS